MMNLDSYITGSNDRNAPFNQASVEQYSCKACGWNGDKEEVGQEFNETINDVILYCPDCLHDKITDNYYG